MGHKGVSKRKPKKSKTFSNDSMSGSSNTRPGESPSVQSLVKEKSAPLSQGGANPSAGWNRKNKKGQ